ncbi:WD domain [Leishmania braziliensis]|nr:WD domain [Leishmania braziliensis]
MPSRVTIRCLAAYTNDAEESGGGLVPLFVGREDGTVERYDAIQDAELGIPTVSFYAHRNAVTAIVALSPAELYTCSLDGTVKQWMLEEVEGALSLPSTGGLRARAVLVKSSTFPFAVCTMVQDGNDGVAAGQQRLFLGGVNGSLTLMDGDRRSTWPAHNGGALTTIAVDWNNSGSVITGGTDGLIYVWDMEFGRPVCELRGHTGAITSLFVVPVPSSIPVVRSKRAPADPALFGSSTALPPASETKDVLVYADADEDGGSACCLVSCSEDSTLKVWLLPDLQEAAAEADLMEREQQQQQRHNSEDGASPQRRSVCISFQDIEPAKLVAEDVSEETVGIAPASGSSTDGAAVIAAATNASGEDVATDASTSPTATTREPESQVYNAKLHFLQQQAAGTAWKSALKAPERRTVPFHSALGTVELPHRPFSCSGASPGMSDGRGSASSLAFIGAAQGYVYGLKDRLLVKEVCQHTAHNFQKVQKAVRSVQRTLKDGVKVYTRAAAAAMKAMEAKELKAAAKACQVQRAKERAAKKKEVEERRAARRAAAAAAAEDRSDKEDYEEEEEEELEEELEEEVEEDEVEEDEESNMEEAEKLGYTSEAADGEENGVEGMALTFTRDNLAPRRPTSWKKLTEEQRAALEAFFAAQEKKRDEQITALRKSVEAHLAQLQPLTKTPYHRSREQFSNLPYTTMGCVRGGSAVVSLAPSSLVPGCDKVYVTQANSIAAVAVQFGVTNL